jgi:hypothetical protein
VLILQETARPHPLDSHLLPLGLQEPKARHPVEQLTLANMKEADMFSNFAIRNIYGEHMVTRFEMEKAITSSFCRLPVLKSELPSYVAITKGDVEVDFSSEYSMSSIIELSHSFFLILKVSTNRKTFVVVSTT